MLVVKTINEYGKNDFYNLYDNAWSGAIDTLDNIKNANLEEDFMDLLDTYFSCEEELTDTELNDFIWFERYTIYEELGLNENDKLIEDIK